MQTLYACKDFSAYLVDSKYTGHEASTSLAGANTLARDSSHASTRSRTRRWHRGGLPGELQNQACLSAVQRCPIHRPLPGPGKQRLGVSSRELQPKLERHQRRAGVHNLFVYRIDSAIAAGCLRKEASFCMLPQIDRRGGSKGRKPT
jgi:hypothetical protein